MSLQSDLGLRVMRCLHEADGPARSADLAEVESVTPDAIRQVAAHLVRAGWVSSSPGPRGGYRINVDLADVSVLELVEVIEGPIDDGRCVLAGSDCDSRRPCAFHDAWVRAREALRSSLAAVSLAAASAPCGTTSFAAHVGNRGGGGS